MHNYPWRDTCHGVLNLIKDTNMRNTISPLSLPTKNLAMKRRDAMLTVGLIFFDVSFHRWVCTSGRWEAPKVI